MRPIQEIVIDTASFVQRSPIALHSSRKPLPVSALTSELDELKKDMQTISGKLVQPLKTVMMGEVKAGKSTLINTLVGADVSPVDVKEATSAIIVIRHSEEPYGKIIYAAPEPSVLGTPEDIYELLRSNRGAMDFFARVKEVELGFPLPNLRKLHVVDTPGLATVTTANEETTTRYMQEADVVVWVLNANHLGQADVEESLSHVAKMGKPIIGVLSRIDEVDGDKDRLVDYVEQELGIYLHSVFPVSGYQAHQAQKAKDPVQLRESGFLDLLAFLEKQIEARVETVHRESIVQSVLALLRKNLAFHESYARSMQFLRSQVKEHQNDLDYHNQRIKQELEENFRHWAEFEFLRAEKQEVHEMIQNMRLLSGKQEKMNIEFRLEHYFSADNINRQINQKLQELHADMQDQWRHALDSIQERRAKQFQEFAKQEQQELQLSLYETLPSGQELALEGAGKGAAIAGAWGATAAAYAAWFGPYASTVTIGAAAGAILPPLLIAGAVTGAVAKLVSFKRQKKRYQNELDQAFAEAKREITSHLVPKLVASIRSANDDFVSAVQCGFVEMSANGSTEEEIEALERGLAKYIEENKGYLNRWNGEAERALRTFA